MIKKIKNKIKSIFRIKKNISNDPWKEAKIEDNYKILYEKYYIDFKKLLKNDFIKNKICFVMHESSQDYKNFKKACEELNIEFNYINPLSNNFFKEIKKINPDGIIYRPAHHNSIIRNMFDEKLWILEKDYNNKIYPTPLELFIYESKRRLAYFLENNNIPHPDTHIFYEKIEAIEFIKKINYPIIFKNNLGSAAAGVVILNNFKEALSFVDNIFDNYYLKKYADKRDFDWGYVLFQKFIPQVREFRIIKIGDSWFGHEKLKKNKDIFHSGSGEVGWIKPDERLLNFCYELANKFNFTTMAFDVFEDKSGNYYINELQTWFGSYNPSQMYINLVPGRFIKFNNEWVFEEGLYNINGSASLRIIEFLKILNKN